MLYVFYFISILCFTSFILFPFYALCLSFYFIKYALCLLFYFHLMLSVFYFILFSFYALWILFHVHFMLLKSFILFSFYAQSLSFYFINYALCFSRIFFMIFYTSLNVNLKLKNLFWLDRIKIWLKSCDTYRMYFLVVYYSILTSDTYRMYFLVVYYTQGYNARKVNCGRVYSVQHIETSSLWAEFVNKNRCIQCLFSIRGG